MDYEKHKIEIEETSNEMSIFGDDSIVLPLVIGQTVVFVMIDPILLNNIMLFEGDSSDRIGLTITRDASNNDIIIYEITEREPDNGESDESYHGEVAI